MKLLHLIDIICNMNSINLICIQKVVVILNGIIIPKIYHTINEKKFEEFFIAFSVIIKMCGIIILVLRLKYILF